MTAPIQPLPAQYNFTIYRGDTRVWEHHFTDDNGAPLDITGWAFEAQYRKATEDADVLATEECDIVDGPGGIMRRTLTHTEAAKITPGPTNTVTWDLQATKTDGSVKTYLFCKRVKVDEDTTR